MMSLYRVVATINLILLLVGFTFRKRDRRVHALFMALGIASDLALVIVLQVRRHAVQTALAFKLSGWNQAHIFCSTTAASLYIPTVVLGVLLFRALPARELPEKTARHYALHKKLGWITLIFRTAGFFLMFTMQSKS